ncbi:MULTISPECIES: hypothetical protein [Brevibacillus]|uniref:hypothetical protein n=1 Tax=Brevibacillus TaxID=55080 RepID=UPI000D0ECC42|nr:MULTISPECIES: hypothetical protein [Brevibacillus]MED1947050.1 hypothetical protein [Brevibacillus formosus]MED2000474.1 hypothetical protein [Brevibacillus formosus]MED2085737.1 hypothetical protein [Brevibacillus formosus]PSK13502.1 hypothetical protein C7R94_22725 [Brevibacillus sp. NRRL NRS-603]
MKKYFMKLLVATFALTFVIGYAVPAQKASALSLILFMELKKAAEDVADSLPNDIMDDDITVDLGSFKDKHGNTPLTKSSGEFKNGKWTVEKDTAGHLGWNGEKKAWKLKKSGDRKASLDKDGVVLGK